MNTKAKGFDGLMDLRKQIVDAVNKADLVVTLSMDGDNNPNIEVLAMHNKDELKQYFQVLQSFFAQADIEAMLHEGPES